MSPFRTLARRLLSRFTTKKTTGVPNLLRFRPRLEQCEDRTVPTPVVTVQALADATEGGPPGLFRFTRDTTSGSLYVMLYPGGTATSGSDYTGANSVRFADGEATVDLNVTATDDSEPESIETLVLGIVPFYTYTVGTQSSAFIFLHDNDTPVVTVAKIADATEGGTAGTFRFTRSGSTYSSLTANFTVSGTATSVTDFTALGTSVTFTYGQATADVTLTASTDNRVEGTETAIVTLGTGSGYTIGTANAATANIADDPPVVSVTATDATEGGATGSFVFTRSGGKLSEALPVVYWLTGSADEEGDYTANLSGLTGFNANETSVTLTLTAVDDTESEYEETVDVEIAPSEDYPIYFPENGYVIDGGFASATIHDNETPVITAYKTARGTSARHSR
jgi:Calx-beta domain